MRSTEVPNFRFNSTSLHALQLPYCLFFSLTDMQGCLSVTTNSSNILLEEKHVCLCGRGDNVMACGKCLSFAHLLLSEDTKHFSTSCPAIFREQRLTTNVRVVSPAAAATAELRVSLHSPERWGCAGNSCFDRHLLKEAEPLFLAPSDSSSRRGTRMATSPGEKGQRILHFYVRGEMRPSLLLAVLLTVGLLTACRGASLSLSRFLAASLWELEGVVRFGFKEITRK